LEVFGLIKNLETPRPSAAPNAQPKKSQYLLAFTAAFLFISLVGGLVGLVLKFQFSILEELKNERSSRLISEERTAKITEKLADKIIADASEAQQTMISSLTKASQEQADSIQKLNEQVEKLQREKKGWRKEKTSQQKARP
jgi:hypothetical protein